MSIHKKLAAIMFTDIVGYTALMGSDEDHAFEVLRKNREIHIKYIAQFEGILVKEMGDGMLAQFDSAIDSVLCALEIQKEAGKVLDHKIRIGLHLGDITREHNDIFGDGVNLASRLQSIADPGGIYISESIQKSVRANSNIKTKYLGQFRLKNVSYPVNTYSILDECLPVPTPSKIDRLTGKTLYYKVSRSPYTYIIIILLLIPNGWWIRNTIVHKNTQISSLLILPFDNFTGSDTLDYLFNGIHDAVIGDVGKISALRVPGNRTANAYRNAEKSIPEIASETNVDAAVEISVSCYGEEICFRVKIVSAFPEEKQLWIDDFYMERDQLSNFSKRIARKISEEIDVPLTPGEEKRLAESDPIDPAAYEAYMRGMSYWELGKKSDLDKAMSYFKLALEIDPSIEFAKAGLEKLKL